MSNPRATRRPDPLPIVEMLNVDEVDLPAGSVITTAQPTGMVRAVSTEPTPAVGLLKGATAVGFVGEVQTDGDFEIQDWTEITGEEFLTYGAPYYLSSTPGMLTATPPSVVSNEMHQQIGTAVSPTKLSLSFSPTIFL